MEFEILGYTGYNIIYIFYILKVDIGFEFYKSAVAFFFFINYNISTKRKK